MKKMKSTGVFLFGLLILISVSCSKNKEVLSVHEIERIEKEIPELMKQAMIPGISITVIKDGSIIWTNSFGVKNIETGELIDSSTVFEAASLSKPVFAYAVLKLVDQNKLDLDTPLLDYIGEDTLNIYYPESNGADNRYKTITARMVLTHSTGLPNWINQGKLSFQFDPGDKFSYSGEGFSYLSIVVEKITGMKLNEYVSETVFHPLNMNNSSFVWLDKYEDLFASSHNFLGEKTERGKNTKAVAGASLYTTSIDYARFLLALINGWGISNNTYDEMLKSQIDVSARYINNEKVFDWGLGIGLNLSNKSKTCWHWGDNGDFKSYFEISTRTKTGVVFFVNGKNGHALTDKLVQMTTGISQPAITTNYFSYPTYDSFVFQMLKSYKDGGIQALCKRIDLLNDSIIQNEPYIKYALLDLGTYLLNSNRIVDSRKVFAESSNIFSDDVSLLINLAGIDFFLGSMEKALSTLKQALVINKNIESHINILGYRLLNAEKFKEAIQVFAFNVESFPESANCYDSLGEAYLTVGDMENASVWYKKSAELFKQSMDEVVYEGYIKAVAEKLGYKNLEEFKANM